MSSPIEQIKERLSIVDLISSYLKLEKAGTNFKARCPFHNEKTPSFVVSPIRQSYYCFGCHKGGDIFSFIQEIEGIDFKEALKLLAERTGVDLVKTEYKVKNNKDILFKTLEISTRYYQKQLTLNQTALSYLKDRGVNEESIKIFRLGYAPDGWRNLLDNLAKYLKKNWLEEVGLIIKKNDYSFYDRFRNRIMFPITDYQDRVIGFSGRSFGDQEAKYINSPQTTLYDKSKALYGFSLAKQAIREKKYCILVEGQFDLILSHQVGYKNTVAVSGTALTEDHLKVISRLTDTILMSFDADQAGVNASKKGLLLALKHGLEVKIISLPNGKDPADIISSNQEQWSSYVSEAKHVINFYLDYYQKQIKDKRELNKLIRQEIYPFINLLTHSTDQAYFINFVSQVLGLPEDSVWQDFNSLNHQIQSEDNNTKEFLLGSREEKIKKRLGIILVWLEDKLVNDLDELIINKWGNQFLSDLRSIVKPEDMISLDISNNSVEQILQEAKELIKELEIVNLKNELKKNTKFLKEAEINNNQDLVDKYMKKCQDISQQLNKLI